ncbi:MAG: hypothetical protein NC078_12155 [Ruminococcus sp.]|nr:hypothetical protein [Ruminococcus sp.]
MLLAVTAVIFAALAALALWDALKKEEKGQGYLVIVPLKKGTDNTELILREAAAAGGKLLIADMGADDEAMEICRRVLGDSEIIGRNICGEPAAFGKMILEKCGKSDNLRES